jgi:arylformamidase
LAVSEPGFAEREYNLRQAFPDHPHWFARWSDDSVAARACCASYLDVRYGPAPKQTLDLFPAVDATTTLLFIHGGFWRALDKSEHSFVAPPFVARGIGVAVANYDLCPAVSVGEIVGQCRQAVVWLCREGTRYGLATQRIAVAGHSAGGHLAAMLFATDWTAYGLDPRVIVSGIAISGVFDLSPLVDVSFNVDMRLDPVSARALSPSRLQPLIHAPMLLAAGGSETSEFIRQSNAQWEHWPQCRPRGARGPLFIAEHHHFSVLSELAQADSALTAAAIDLCLTSPA